MTLSVLSSFVMIVTMSALSAMMFFAENARKLAIRATRLFVLIAVGKRTVTFVKVTEK